MQKEHNLSKNQKIIFDLIDKSGGPMKAFIGPPDLSIRSKMIFWFLERLCSFCIFKFLSISYQFFNLIDCLILSKDNINKIKEAIIIEGPDDVLNSRDENNPNTTDNKPPMIE